MMGNAWRRKTLIWIFSLTLLKVIFASFTDLGNDEVYYTLYAKSYQWNYFDHPPMIGWLLRIISFNYSYPQPFLFRLVSILCGTATLWVIFLIGKNLKNEKAGFLATLFWGGSTYATLISGTFILPDGPQVLCWSLALHALFRFLKNPQQRFSFPLIFFGIFAGLAMLSKVHTVFLWLGFFIWVLIHNRATLKNPAFYIAGVLSLLLFAPVIGWNIQEHFITYNFHSNRINNVHKGIRSDTFFPFVLGQFLYANVVLIPLWFLSVKWVIKRKLPDNHLYLILLYTSLPLYAILLISSLFNTALPHWSGPSFIGLSVVSGLYFEEKYEHYHASSFYRVSKFWPFVICLLLTFLVNFLPGTLGDKSISKLGKNDPSLDLWGWRDAAQDVAPSLKELQRDYHCNTIVSNKWFPGAHIEYYIADRLGWQMICLGSIENIHQYFYLNRKRNALKPGDNAICIVPSNNPMEPGLELSGYFSSIEKKKIINLYRNGKQARCFTIYLLKGYNPVFPNRL